MIKLSHEVLEVSSKLHSMLYSKNEDAEPLLIVDQMSMPRRLFVVWYYVGGGGEFSRPLYKKDLTGYDCEIGLLYPTQTTRLDTLQDLVESQTYGSSETILSRIIIRDASTRGNLTLKALVSKLLVEKLVALYDFAW